MYRKHLLTAGVGILGVLFSLVAVQSDLPENTRFLLGMVGAAVFLWSALTLYFEWKGRPAFPNGKGRSYSRGASGVTQMDLVNEEGTVIASWDLYQKTSALIGKDFKENRVDIDLGRSEYAALVDVHHAVLNYADGSWYVEDLGSKNGVIVQKLADGRKYKLSPDQPCRLQNGDVLLIGMSRLRLH